MIVRVLPLTFFYYSIKSWFVDLREVLVSVYDVDLQMDCYRDPDIGGIVLGVIVFLVSLEVAIVVVLHHYIP
jgi:hypothetical protein